MTYRSLAFVVLVALFMLFVGGIALRYYRRRHQNSNGTWQELISRLRFVDRDCIARIARGELEPRSDMAQELSTPEPSPDGISNLIGGVNGLDALANNAEVLADIAAYLQQWHPEALVMAEQLRLSARDISWHVDRLKVATRLGKDDLYFADYAKPAIARYYSMTCQVLALYDGLNSALYLELQKAI